MLATIDLAELASVINDALDQAVEPLQARERALAAEIEALRTALRAQVDLGQIERLVTAEVAKQMPPPPPAPAEPTTPGVTINEAIEMIERAIAAIPPASDGRTPAEDELRPIIAREVDAALAARPPPADGKDADPAVTAVLIEKAVAALPPPLPGISVTVDELRPVIEEVVERRFAALPPAKDGVGLAGAIIDRDHKLILTLSDGSQRDCGVVVGRDADMDALAAIIVREIAKIPAPRDGIDGLGFDEVSVVHDGERLVTIRFARADHVKEFPLTIPAIIDRGIWREDKYAKGDGVTWEGSFFIAQCDTEGKPLLNADWRQAVKAGRPGKNTETVKYLPATVKLPE